MASDVNQLKARFESPTSDDGLQGSKPRTPTPTQNLRPSNSPTPPPKPESTKSPTPPPKPGPSKSPLSSPMSGRRNLPSPPLKSEPTKSPTPPPKPGLNSIKPTTPPPKPGLNSIEPPTTASKPPQKLPKPPPRSAKVNKLSASLLQNIEAGAGGRLKGMESPEGKPSGPPPPKPYEGGRNRPPLPLKSPSKEEGASNAAAALANILQTSPSNAKRHPSPTQAKPLPTSPVRSKSAKSPSTEDRLQINDRNKAKSMDTGLNEEPAAPKPSPIRNTLKFQEKAKSLESEQHKHPPAKETQRPMSAGVFKILLDDEFLNQPMRQRSSPVVSDSDTPESSPAIARRRSRLQSRAALSASYENALNDPVSSPYVPRANKTFSESPPKLTLINERKARTSSLPRDARMSASPPPVTLQPAESKLRSVSNAPSGMKTPPNPPVKPGTKPKPAAKPRPPPKPPSLSNLKNVPGFSRPLMKRVRSQASSGPESLDDRRSSSRETTPDVQTPVVGPAASRIWDTQAEKEEAASGSEGVKRETTTSGRRVNSPEVVVEDETGLRTEGLPPPTQTNDLKESPIGRRGNVDSGFISEAAEDLVIGGGREASIESNGPESEGKPVAKEIEVWDEARLEKARVKRKNIAKELLETEKTYVDRLKVVAVDFYGAVMQFNERKAIPDSDVQQMFLNAPQIYELNKQLLEELQARLDMWSTKEGLGDAICRLAPFLKLYSTYTAGFEDAMKKLTEWTAKDKKFDTLVRETERQISTGLGVAHYMLEPVQRIPRYRLLLRDYLKYLPDDAEDRPATEKALGIISEAADRTNDRIKELEISNEILTIQRSIQDYEGTLLAPSRVFIKKGTLQKSSRKTFTPRIFFLFSDILLHTVPSGNDIYKFKNEMPIFGMQVEVPKVSMVPFSFSVHSTTRSLILAANSEQEKQEWMEALLMAIDDDRKKRKSLRRESTAESDVDDQEFGAKAPIMVPDKSVTMCQVCSSPFTFTFRRHHCRACGKVVCGSCSLWRAFLSYMQKQERVCEECYKLAAGEEKVEVDGPPSPPRTPKREGVLNLKAYDEQDTVIAGYVLFQDGKKWNRLWYQVKQDLVLYKFKAHEDIKAIHSMPLPGYIVTTDPEKNIINLGHVSKKKNLCDVFQIENTTEFDNWVSVLEKAVKFELPISTPVSPRSSMDVDEKLRSLSLCASSGSPEGTKPAKSRYSIQSM